MNFKKVISALLASLGTFSLALTGCNNKKNSDSVSSDNLTPSNSASSSGQSSHSQETSSSTSSVEEYIPEAKLYDVIFNFDDSKNNTTIWTDFEINKTVAPLNKDSGRFYSEQNGNRHTVPLTKGGNLWYIAVDEAGYIVYASYGTGLGYGSPSDDFYYNVSSKPVTDDAEFWSLHEQFATYSEIYTKITLDSQYEHFDGDGNKVTELVSYEAYDLLVPTNGFIIKGNGDESTFVDLCRQLRPNVVTDQMTILPSGATNNFLGLTPAKTFNKFYLSIVEDTDGTRKLSVKERTTDEIVDDSGYQEKDTYAKAFTSTDDDKVTTYITTDDIATLDDSSTFENLKGVVSYSGGNTVIIVDENHKSVLVNDETITKDYKVGDTIVVNGTKTTTNGYLTVNATSVLKLDAFGQLKPEDVTTIKTINEAKDVWKVDNNYKVIKVVGAKVVSIDATGTSTIKLVEDSKEFTMNLYKTTFPDTVTVGDMVDVTCAIVCNNTTVQAIVATSDDILRYYNIEVDVDGDKGELESEKFFHATGNKVTLTPKIPNQDYEFSHWEKWNEIESTWEEVSDEIDFEIEVGKEDAKYKAVFDYAAWKNLPPHMGLSGTIDVLSTETDSKFTVIDDSTIVINEDWTTSYAIDGVGERTILIVDNEGKIAYFVYNPANGYGEPSGTKYYTHPDYASDDYHNNPSFNILEENTKFELHAPEGGFLITSYDTSATSLVMAITNNVVSELSYNLNTRNLAISQETRIYYDKDKKFVKVYVPSLDDGNYLASYNQSCLTAKTDITVYTDDKKNPNVSKYDFATGRHTFNTQGLENVIAVDNDGKIIYASSGLRAGYATPSDDFYSGTKDGNVIIPKSTSVNKGKIVGDFFALGPNYSTYGEWFASGSTNEERNPNLQYGDFETLVPTDGFVITGSRESKEMKLLWAEVFGKNLYNKITNDFNTASQNGTFDNVKVELIDVNGVPQIHIVNGTASYVDTNLSKDEKINELKSLENYTEATYGSTDKDMFSNINVIDENIIVTSKNVANEAYVITDDNLTFTTTISPLDNKTGFTISVPTYNLLSHSYYLVIEWTIDETNYKSLIYHNENSEEFTFAASKIGQSFTARVDGKIDNVAVWNGFKGSWDITFTINREYGYVQFLYTDSENNQTILTKETSIFKGAVVLVDSADWTRNLYNDPGNPLTWFCCLPTGSTYTASYFPNTNTVTIL